MLWRVVFTKVLFTLVATQLLLAENPERVRRIVNDEVRRYIFGQIHPLARPESDIGRAAADLPISDARIIFKRSAQQERDLERLLAQQEDPACALYHHWLSPQQFADRFGISVTDRLEVEAWLQSEGLTIDDQSSSATSVYFSGTVATLEHAFGTEFHIFRIQGHGYLANAYELSVPAALAPLVSGFRNLDTFRVYPRTKDARQPYVAHTRILIN